MPPSMSAARPSSPTLSNSKLQRDDVVTLPQSPPPTRRSLKRSASTASLPTPPRTRRDRERRRLSRGSPADSSSEDEPGPVKSNGGRSSKRRRISANGGDDEDAFWMGLSADNTTSTRELSVDRGEVSADEHSSGEIRSPSPDIIAPHLLKKVERHRNLHASGASSLASPPPSRRAPSTVFSAKPSSEKLQPASPPPVLALPITPRQTQKRPPRQRTAIRDSPENPFLDDGNGEERPEANVLPPEEKPTVTYVFRGKKAEFRNPHYKHDEDGQSRIREDAKHHLPLHHPDYSPDPRCPPKRLFAGVGKRQRDNHHKKGARLLDEDEDASTSSDEELDATRSVARKLFDTTAIRNSPGPKSAEAVPLGVVMT